MVTSPLIMLAQKWHRMSSRKCPGGHPKSQRGMGRESALGFRVSSWQTHPPELTGVKQELFGLGVRGELGSVDHHGTGHGGDTALGEKGVFGSVPCTPRPHHITPCLPTSPPTDHALLPHHAGELSTGVGDGSLGDTWLPPHPGHEDTP